MKPMNEEHLAILRRHMVEAIAIHADLLEEELGKVTLDGRAPESMPRVPRHHFCPGRSPRSPTGTRHCRSALTRRPRNPSCARSWPAFSPPTPTMWCSRSAPAWATKRRCWRSWRAGSGASDRRGARGRAEHAPFDKILVATAAERRPPALLEQPKPGGRLVLPVGPGEGQRLTVIDKGTDGHTRVREVIPVRFSRLETVV